MAPTSVGYDGTVREGNWARLARFLGTDYGVGGPNDWKVEAVTGADRTVRIRAGSGYGHGVLDTTSTNETLQLPIVSSGSRWDTVVARRDWQGDSGATEFAYETGGVLQSVATGINNSPGVIDDQLLALVRITAGQQVPTAVIDLRQREAPHVQLVTSDTLPGTNGTPPPDVPELAFELDSGRWRYWTGAAWADLGGGGNVVGSGSATTNKSIVAGNPAPLDLSASGVTLRGGQNYAIEVRPGLECSANAPVNVELQVRPGSTSNTTVMRAWRHTLAVEGSQFRETPEFSHKFTAGVSEESTSFHVLARALAGGTGLFTDGTITIREL